MTQVPHATGSGPLYAGLEAGGTKAARQNNLCISDLGASAYAASAANTENKAAMPMAILFWRGS